MADKKISQLTAAAALTGSEPIPTVQGGVTVQTTAQDIADLAAGGSSFIPNGIKVITESRELESDDAGYFLFLNNSNPAVPVVITIPEESPVQVGKSFVLLNGNTTYDKDNGFFIDGLTVKMNNGDVVLFTTTFVDDKNVSTPLSPRVIKGSQAYTQFRYFIDNIEFKGTATLSAGTVTVADARVKTGAKIFVSVDTPGGTQGFLSAPVASIVDETSFVINSSSATETSTVNYLFVNP